MKLSTGVRALERSDSRHLRMRIGRNPEPSCRFSPESDPNIIIHLANAFSHRILSDVYQNTLQPQVHISDGHSSLLWRSFFFLNLY